jgi:hypothetical protein
MAIRVPLEALAMAGADYLEFSLDAEEWESQDLMQAEAPPHLLVEEEEEEEQGAFPTTHIFRSLHAEDYGDGDDDDRVAVKCQSKLGVGGIIDESTEKCLSSIRLVVRAIMRLLLIIRIDFKSSF